MSLLGAVMNYIGNSMMLTGIPPKMLEGVSKERALVELQSAYEAEMEERSGAVEYLLWIACDMRLHSLIKQIVDDKHDAWYCVAGYIREDNYDMAKYMLDHSDCAYISSEAITEAVIYAKQHAKKHNMNKYIDLLKLYGCKDEDIERARAAEQ